MDVIIYHNPDCGTSRNTLAMIRNAGVEPHVIEYLKTPPSRDMLTRLIARMGISARELLREKGTPYAELGLRSEEHTSELQSLMRNSYAVFCLKKTKNSLTNAHISQQNHNAYSL